MNDTTAKEKGIQKQTETQNPQNKYRHDVKIKVFSSVFGSHPALNVRLFINSNIFPVSFESMIYLCFFNYDNGLSLHHHRQTQAKPRRTNHRLNGKQQKKIHTETQYKYNLNVRCPKSCQKLLSYFAFLVWLSFILFLVFSLTNARCYVESTVKPTDRSRTSKTIFQISGLSVM